MIDLFVYNMLDFINTTLLVSLPPRYKCNTVESIAKHHNPNPCGATNGVRAGHPSGAHVFTPIF